MKAGVDILGSSAGAETLDLQTLAWCFLV